jgi:hypothetical protein
MPQTRHILYSPPFISLLKCPIPASRRAHGQGCSQRHGAVQCPITAQQKPRVPQRTAKATKPPHFCHIGALPPVAVAETGLAGRCRRWARTRIEVDVKYNALIGCIRHVYSFRSKRSGLPRESTRDWSCLGNAVLAPRPVYLHYTFSLLTLLPSPP